MTGRRIGGLVQEEMKDIDTWDEFRDAAGQTAAFADKCFVVDIDGVLATITPGNDYSLAEPIQANVDAVNRLYEAGNRIVLFTARGSATGIDWAETTQNQMATWGVRYHELRFGKPAADYYVDDRLLPIEEIVRRLRPDQAPSEEGR